MKSINKTIPDNSSYGFAKYILGNAESQHIELTSHSNPETPDVDTYETVNIHNVASFTQQTKRFGGETPFKVTTLEVVTEDGATVYIKLFGDIPS